MCSRSPARVDPVDPRAPSVAVWAALSAAERARVVAELPSEVPIELSPPEGDPHRKAKQRAVEALETFFRRSGRNVYVSSGLAVYYPEEALFAPDLLAVLDLEPHDRDKWVVSAEQRGIDFILEVLYHGDANKDLEENVKRYARLGVREYFVFDRGRGRLHGFALASDANVYQPIVPQRARWASGVLGLVLSLEAERVRFHAGSAPLPELEELALRAEALLADTVARKEDFELLAQQERERADGERERADGERERADEERERADRAERAVAELRARIDELERGRR